MKTKLLFQKIKKHFWPQNNLQSVAEILGYLILLSISLVAFFRIQRVSVHKDEITIDKIKTIESGNYYCSSAEISFHLPYSYALLEESGKHGNVRVKVTDHYFVKDSTFQVIDNTPYEDSLLNQFISFCPNVVFSDYTNVLYHVKNHVEFGRKKYRLINDGGLNVDTLKNRVIIIRKNNSAIETEIYSLSPIIIDKTDSTDFAGPYSKPSYTSLFDVSQSYYDIKLNGDVLVDRIDFDFVGVVDFSKMYPEPDEVTMNSISFVDSLKIQEIKERGLKFHAKFIELEPNQTIRLFLVSAVLSALFAIFIAIIIAVLVLCFRKAFNLRRNIRDKKREKREKTTKEPDNLIQNN